MQLLKVTAKRVGHDLQLRSRRVLGAIPDDPRYWEPMCDIILGRMRQDGIIPPQDNDTVIPVQGQGNPVQKEVRKVV